jgi:DNA-binding GntR family transcriptional regulator
VAINTNKNPLLKQGESVGPQVYKILRQQIIYGNLLPGIRISEAEISGTFNVSRQPIREAFIKLCNEGLVEVRPQRGTFVTKIRIDAVSDARFIREAIEADIVKYLVEQSNPQLVSKLRVLLTKQRELLPLEIDQFMECDEQFHRSLAEFAGKPIAWKVISNMKAHLDRVRHLSSTIKPIERLVNQHEAIVDAIEKKDKVAADEAIRGHMREVLLDLPLIVARQPELFSEYGAPDVVNLETTG